jgi:hypothetical protein
MDEQMGLSIRVEAVNVWHPRWDEVLEAIEQLGQRDCLHLEEDGWLSARRVLLVGFVDDVVAGHVSFRVQPLKRDDGQLKVEAAVEAFGMQWGFDERNVGLLLRSAAKRRAQSLGCFRLVGFEAPRCEKLAGCGAA